MNLPLHARIATISGRLENWWLRGPQSGPVLVITLPGGNPVSIPPPLDPIATLEDPDFALRHAMAMMESHEYAGAAIPYHYVHLGSGSMAPLLGAGLERKNESDCIVRPTLQRIEDVIDLVFDPGNTYYRAVRRIMELSSAGSFGHHYVAPFTLGGLADTAAGLYGPENLALDMMDRPQAVRHALGRLRQLWMELFEDFQRIIAQGGNPGSISRLGVWAPGSTLCIREDFAQMISRDAFRTFCLPAIADMLRVTDWPSFLLTPGSLRHLDAVLELTELNVIQWQPPPGRERLVCWYDLIRHILGQGRAMQLTAGADEVVDLVQAVGAERLLLVIRDATAREAEELMERYSQD